MLLLTWPLEVGLDGERFAVMGRCVLFVMVVVVVEFGPGFVVTGNGLVVVSGRWFVEAGRERAGPMPAAKQAGPIPAAKPSWNHSFEPVPDRRRSKQNPPPMP